MRHLLIALGILIFAKQGMSPDSYTFTVGPGYGDHVLVYFTGIDGAPGYILEWFNVKEDVEYTVTRDGKGMFKCLEG